MKPRELGGAAAGDGDGLPVGPVDELPLAERDGVPLGSVTVVPNGVGEAPGVTVVPGTGVAVGGTPVGLGDGLGVTGGGGVGAGVGVGAVTMTGETDTGAGFNPLTVVPLNVAVQLPTGSDRIPVQIWLASGPPVREREKDVPATDTVTVDVVSVPG